MKKSKSIRETKFFTVFYKLESFITIAALAIIIVLTSYNVILRYIFRRGSLWTDEFIGFLMVLMAMLGMTIGVKEKSHSALESLVCKFSKPVQKIVYIFDSLIVIVFLSVAVYGGFKFVNVVKAQKMVILKWPVSIMYSFVVIGCLLALIEQIINTIEAIRKDECRFIPLEEQMEMNQEFNQSI